MPANEMSTARAVLFRQELVLEACIHLLWHVLSLDNKLSTVCNKNNLNIMCTCRILALDCSIHTSS